MPPAARSSSRAGVSRPRNARRHRWPGILKLSTGALAIVIAGCVVCVAALTGVGWLVAVSPEARTEFRPVVRTTLLDHRQTLPNREATFRFNIPATDPLGALARMIPDSLDAADDRIVTASIGPYVPKRVTLQIF